MPGQHIDINPTRPAESLGSGVPIVITTLRKFPFVTEKEEFRKTLVAFCNLYSFMYGAGDPVPGGCRNRK